MHVHVLVHVHVSKCVGTAAPIYTCFTCYTRACVPSSDSVAASRVYVSRRGGMPYRESIRVEPPFGRANSHHCAIAGEHILARPIVKSPQTSSHCSSRSSSSVAGGGRLSLGVEVSRPGVEGVELLSRGRGVEACRGLSRPVEAETMLVRVEECRGVSRVSRVSSVSERVERVERVSSVVKVFSV